MTERCSILMISGSLRRGSTNTAVLRTAAAVAEQPAVLGFAAGMADLPHFNPDDDAPPLDPAVHRLRTAIGDADAVLLSTPEYAGALPGSFKNLLDWTVGDDQPRSMSGKPVAWINCSPRGAAGAHAALRVVLGYLGAAIVEEACVHVPVTHRAVGPDGTVTSAAIRRSLTGAVAALAGTASA